MTRGEPAWSRFRGDGEGRAREETGRQLRGKVEPGQILLSVCLPACLPSFPFFLPLPPSGTAYPHMTQGQAGPHALDCLPV